MLQAVDRLLADGLAERVDCLVAGDHPDDDRLDAAKQVRVPTLDERAFSSLLVEYGVDYPP